MARATFLTRVVLENYKSIAHCDVRLGPLNYLVGPNGSGKSNFLDALRFVADVKKHSVEQALRKRGGGGAICHAPHKQEGYFCIRLEFIAPDGGTVHYRLEVRQFKQGNPTGPWEVSERIDYPTELDNLAVDLINTSIASMLFYNINPQRIEDVINYEPVGFLPEDGSSLANVFFRLGLPPAKTDERINEYLRLILPGLDRVRAELISREGSNLPFETQKIALFFEQLQAGRVHRFWPSQMSDGTLRMLGILTALLQAAPKLWARPSLVAIEEPEAQVHPAALAVLRDALFEASYSTQVLVTTHSPDVLDDKDVETDSILAVTADDGVTRIGPIEEGVRDLIRQRLFTPGELLRIGQLFPEQGTNGSAPDSEQAASVGGNP
jgi:predicted ATPase